jgi:pimeloyl-ACP methyl ester carboxylesterase
MLLIGYSWGAWLIYFLAARYPEIVSKIVLVGSGPFDEKYVKKLRDTRRNRLTSQEKKDFEIAITALGNEEAADKDLHLQRLGELASKTDLYDPIQKEFADEDRVELKGEIFQTEWNEAAAMRKSGGLLEIGEQITCPVVAIHGDYDPHPAEGVEKPLTGKVRIFSFILLRNCGHAPWLELQARDAFYKHLCDEIRQSGT